jgi:hypothetical protein
MFGLPDLAMPLLLLPMTIFLDVDAVFAAGFLMGAARAGFLSGLLLLFCTFAFRLGFFVMPLTRTARC